MKKLICLSVSLLFTIISYGQNSTLIENVNYRAKELNQNLSQNGDSLLLQAGRMIYKIEIFNQDFEKTINVVDYKAIVSLTDLPKGKYIVDATLYNKHIIMTLIRNKELIESPITANINTEVSNKNLNSEQPKPVYIDRHASLLSKKPRKKNIKPENYYWIKHQINNGSSSYNTMKLVTKNEADKMISKHKLEIKTSKGKLNELTIWEVYNNNLFMEQQIENPEYINSSNSDTFNVLPYYSYTKSIEQR